MIKKDDTKKNRWDLIPFDQLDKIVKVLTFGAEKHGPFDWQHVERKDFYAQFFGAAMRHISAYAKGEVDDLESKQSHLAHACCNLIFLMWFEDLE